MNLQTFAGRKQISNETEMFLYSTLVREVFSTSWNGAGSILSALKIIV